MGFPTKLTSAPTRSKRTREPGTQFELQERPINAEIWLPRLFRMQARAKILFLVNKSSETNESYFSYEPNGKLSIDSCKKKKATENQ